MHTEAWNNAGVGFWWYNVQPHQSLDDTCYSERFSTNQNPGNRMSPSVWLVENCSLWHVSSKDWCGWTLYPKINIQPIRICLTHAQICGMTVGHVSFRWTCIALHSVLIVFEKDLNRESQYHFLYKIYCILYQEIHIYILPIASFQDLYYMTVNLNSKFLCCTAYYEK